MVLENELKGVDADIAENACMCRKYGESYFTEGTAKLAQIRVRAAATTCAALAALPARR